MTKRADWRTDIENAPKDGSDVLFPIEFVARAFWCDDLKRWVLAYPLKMEFVSNPTRFQLPGVSGPPDDYTTQLKRAAAELFGVGELAKPKE